MCVEGGGVRVFGFILAVFPEPAARMSSPDWPVTSAGCRTERGDVTSHKGQTGVIVKKSDYFFK